MSNGGFSPGPQRRRLVRGPIESVGPPEPTPQLKKRVGGRGKGELFGQGWEQE